MESHFIVLFYIIAGHLVVELTYFTCMVLISRKIFSKFFIFSYSPLVHSVCHI